MSTLHPAPPRGPQAPVVPPSRLSIWLDVAVGALVALLCLTGGPVPSLVGDLLFACAIVFRTIRPLVGVALATLGGLVLLVVADVPTFGLVAVPLVTYAVARWSPRVLHYVTGGILAAAAIAGPLRWFGVSNPAAFLVISFTCLVTVAAAYAFGLVLRAMAISRATRARAQAEQVRHQAIQRESELRFNTAAERARIARELHDIVAHSLAVIVVQAEGAKAIAARKPELAVQTLDTIAAASRESLAEMRQMVRLLRGEEGQDADYLPTASLADIDELVERTGNATLTVNGVATPTSPAVELAAYRIVQEALTNVIKHGGPDARAEVSITHHPGLIELVISDNGRGAATTSDGMGNGIRGMGERVQLHGGRLETGPRPGGGFVVRAHLPKAGPAR
ncbi:sensor histidine kinase [Propionibacteriaceae bacterium Y1700]|uniref:sensor histidine kinase n=1 Tax=Microlunatus sp. Y1700 TaxID=3418487 RepID=UPI003DA71CE5